MNAPVPPDDVDSLTLQPWRPPARTARRSGRIVLGVCLVGLGTLGALVLMGVRAPSPDSLYETVVVKRQDIESTVAGVLESKGISERGTDRDNNVVMPLRTGAMRLYGKDDLTEIVVSIADMSRLQQTKGAIQALLIRRHGREDFWLHDAASAFRKAEDERRSTNCCSVPSLQSRCWSAASAS